MRTFVALCCLLLLGGVAAAVENGQVMYVGGTAGTLKEGTIGRLDTTLETALRFEAGSERLEIPFEKIQSYFYTQEVARHLGLLPAIGAGLIRHRQRKHFFRISFRDERGIMQVAVFEVPKEMPRSLLAVLQTRAPRACIAPATECILKR
jgi:hypothetical protein